MAKLKAPGILVKERFLSPRHTLSVPFISDLPAVSHLLAGPWRRALEGDIMARSPVAEPPVPLGEETSPGHQLCRAWGKGWDGSWERVDLSVILSTIFIKCSVQNSASD